MTNSSPTIRATPLTQDTPIDQPINETHSPSSKTHALPHSQLFSGMPSLAKTSSKSTNITGRKSPVHLTSSQKETEETKRNRRAAFVADPENFEHGFSFDPYNSQEEYIAAKGTLPHRYLSEYKQQAGDEDGETDNKMGYFLNEYLPDEWIFRENLRKNVGDEFYASDVSKYQYEQVSSTHGFSGKLPKIITRYNVENEEAEKVARQWEHNPEKLKEAFLAETQNGRNTQRMMKIFGLEATAVEVRHHPDSYKDKIDVLVHVRPISETPTEKKAENTD